MSNHGKSRESQINDVFLLGKIIRGLSLVLKHAIYENNHYFSHLTFSLLH